MRFAAVAFLLSAAAVGLGYGYGEQRTVPDFLTVPVERGSISTVVSATGTVEPVASVNVSSQLSGRIADVFVNFNDLVKAGQPLAQIDPEIYAARLNEAKASLRVARTRVAVETAALQRAKVAVASAKTAKELAEAQSAAIRARQDELQRDYLRKLQLARTGSGTERDLSEAQATRDAGANEFRAAVDEIEMRVQAIAMADAERHMAEANLENAKAVVEQEEAALDQARLDLDRTVLRAPIDGTIIKRDVNPGQTVAVSLEARTLFTIANDLREMEVQGKVDEADIGQLKVGQTAEFTVDAYPDRTFKGRVLQIRKSPELVENVVSYTAIISARNPDVLLLPGMTAELRIAVHKIDDVLKIPSQVLSFRPNRADPAGGDPGVPEAGSSRSPATLWLVGENGRPKPVSVRLGASNDSSTELLAGPLREGERVIIGVASPHKRSGYLGLRLGF